jgi:hypothetical protein
MIIITIGRDFGRRLRNTRVRDFSEHHTAPGLQFWYPAAMVETLRA